MGILGVCGVLGFSMVPVVPFHPSSGESSPTKIDYRKKKEKTSWHQLLTSLLEDLVLFLPGFAANTLHGPSKPGVLVPGPGARPPSRRFRGRTSLGLVQMLDRVLPWFVFSLVGFKGNLSIFVFYIFAGWL